MVTSVAAASSSCKNPTTVCDIVAVCTVGAFEILLEALKALLCDDGFTIPSPSAAAALTTASSLLSWCSDSANHLAFSQFADKLKMRLDKAFYAASTCHYFSNQIAPFVRARVQLQCCQLIKNACKMQDGWQVCIYDMRSR